MAATEAPMLSKTSRQRLVVNPHYKKDGLKSYIHLLRKYDITPTLEGPFSYLDVAVDSATDTKCTIRRVISKVARKTRISNPQSRLVKSVGKYGGISSVTAKDVQNDSLYLAEVSIGTPVQTLNLDFDTGSADLWVWSTRLSHTVQAAGRASGHTIFNARASHSFKMTAHEKWQISYGDGSTAAGAVGTDTIRLGTTVIHNQAIELASTLSDQFQQGQGDGLLGLAFDNINTVSPHPVKTPVDNLTGPKIFTAYLGSWRDKNDADHGESFYTFGGIDEKAVAGQEILYTDIDSSNGFWEFQSTKSIINGQTITITGTAIADTGTTLALVDDATCKAVYDAIPGAQYDKTQQGYIYPANTTLAQLPEVQLAIGPIHFVTIQKEDLGFADAGNGMVYGSIQSRGNMTQSIFGDGVLKSMYAIFDVDHKRFGFVQREGDKQNVAVPPQ